jgi:hypothetical protein
MSSREVSDTTTVWWIEDVTKKNEGMTRGAKKEER